MESLRDNLALRTRLTGLSNNINGNTTPHPAVGIRIAESGAQDACQCLF